MARESSSYVGSGVSVLREIHSVPAMMGSNSVLLNYEDVMSSLGVVQNSGLNVGGTAVQLTAPENRLRGRRKVLVNNQGTALAYIGAVGVTTTNGFPLPSGQTLELSVLDFGHLWVVSAGVSNIRILEIR